MQRYLLDVPPGFENQPILFMLTMFSLLMVTLLSLEWLWRITWGWFENPYPTRHPITVLRIILFCIAISILMRVGPLVARFALWKSLDFEGRMILYQWSHGLDVVSFFPWSFAWLVGYLTMPMLHYQLDKKPLPMHLWPTASQLKRPLKIGVAAFLIAMAITFYG
jgi:hypothetical protein